MQLKLALDKNGSLDEQCAVEVGNSGDSLMALSSSDVAVHDLTSVQRHGADERIESVKETHEDQSEICLLVEERAKC